MVNGNGISKAPIIPDTRHLIINFKKMSNDLNLLERADFVTESAPRPIQSNSLFVEPKRGRPTPGFKICIPSSVHTFVRLFVSLDQN